MRYFDFVRGRRMGSPALAELLGAPRRLPHEPLADFHRDVARSLQVVLEEVLLEKVRYLHARTGAPDLCMAGGVALNCVANGRIQREGRALGGRSLLANPQDPEARPRLNRLIKRREEFRPFAPSVLAEHAAEHFDLDHPSPFMLETCRVTSPLAMPADLYTFV